MKTLTANSKKLIGLVIIGLVILLGISVVNSAKFRIASTTPNHTNYPSSLSVMDVYFNRDLDKSVLKDRLVKDVSQVIKIEFDSKVSVTVYDKRLRLVFSQTPLAGSYIIGLKDINATNGSTLTVSLPFVVKDIPYDELSKAEKDLYNSAAGDQSEGDFDKYPILSELPYMTDDYQIIANIADSDAYPTLTVTMRFFEPGSVAKPATTSERQVYLADLRKYRNEALEWLKSQNINLDDYGIVYSEPDLQNEFPKGKIQ